MRTILRKALRLGVPAILLLLSACASGVTRSTDTALSAPSLLPGDQKAGQISISLTKDAQALAADNLEFNQDELLSTVRRALEAREAITKEPDATLPSVEIIITDMRTRSTFSAVMFGVFAGSDHINGDVVVRAPDGKELQRFSVDASYALGGLAGGMRDTRMDWLYEAFAKRVLEELTGTKSDTAQSG